MHSSKITKNKSETTHNWSSHSDILTEVFYDRNDRQSDWLLLKIDVRAFKVAWIPALAIRNGLLFHGFVDGNLIEMSILSNSSIAQIPLSANIKAPASIVKSPVSSSFKTEAVKPAALDAFPEV